MPLIMNRLRRAWFRLNCTLQDPENWVGYCNDPAMSTGLCLWIYLGPHQFFWAPWRKFAYLRRYNQDDCPACGRIHFPWCGKYGDPKIWP